MKEIICAGFGGQGVLTAGLILSNAALQDNKNVTWIPSYGSEMRGGTANCNVKISEDLISSPFVKKIDILIAMNEPSIDKFETSIKTGGYLVLNSDIIGNRTFREDINVVKIPASKISTTNNNPRGLNIAMLGGMIAKTNLFEKEFFIKVIDEYFEKKGKNNPLNIDVFNEGYKSAI